MSKDRYGLTVSTRSADALEAYVDGVDRLLSASAGSDDCFARAILADDGFALAQAGLARSLAVRGLGAEARQRVAEARGLAAGASRREQQHVEAVAVALEGNLPRALDLVRAHVTDFPRDAVVLSLATGVYGVIPLSGRPDRNELLLDLLDGLATRYGDDWWFLGAHAFAHTEVGRRDEGGRLARRSLDGYARNAHAVHALAHVLYETGENKTGAAWLAEWMTGYDLVAQLHCHLSWHRALFHLVEGHAERAWALYDTAIRPAVSLSAPLGTLADSASFLWRRGLEDDPRVAGGWPEVAEFAGRSFPRAGLAFADAHCGMAAAAVGDEAALSRRVEEAREALAAGRLSAGEVLPRLLEALGAFARGDWARVIERLEPVAGDAARVGGSLAQRDVFEHTLLAAYLRAKQPAAATALLQGRLATRPWAAMA